jgi:hypothetical protein
MPSTSVHLAKAKANILAVNSLVSDERAIQLIDPIATLAYYAAAHALEACFAKGVGVVRRCDCTNHYDRVNTVLRGKATFGPKVASGIKSLFDYSRIARYAQDAGGSARHDTPAGKEPRLIKDSETLKQAMTRLAKCVEKVRELLAVPEDDLPKVEWPPGP